MAKRPHLRSKEAEQYRSWYKLRVWDAARRAQLLRQPLCERCLAQGKMTMATVVNHKRPHKGNWELFINATNHESTCAPHHDGLIQKEEARGHAMGHSSDGRPTDRFHPWNR